MVPGLAEGLIVLGVALAVWAFGTERTLSLLEELKTAVLKFRDARRGLKDQFEWLKKLLTFLR